MGEQAGINAVPDGYPAVNQRIRLILEAAEQLAQLPVTVVGIGEGGSLRLRANASLEGVDLASGTPVTLEYVRQGAVYRMRSRVARRESPVGQGALVVVDRPSELRKVQRRKHTRRYVSLSIEYALLRGPVASDAGGAEVARFPARIRQIGPNGLGMLTDMALAQGDTLMLTVPLGDERITVRGQVVWSGGPGALSRSAGTSDFSHAVGIELVEVDPDTRGILDGFIIGGVEQRDAGA